MQTFGVEVVRDFHNHKKPMFSEQEIPEWVSIYFVPINDKSTMKCNLCEQEIDNTESSVLLDHMKSNHSDIYDLHKDNAEATVGFRVEFLQLSALKEGDGDKPHQVFLSDIGEPAVETEVQDVSQEPEQDDVISMQYVMLDTKRKYTRKSLASTSGVERKRSWIWKYFDKLSNIIYRCNVCNVVLSIKGCNTNNLNRHMRSRHPDSFNAEKSKELVAKREQSTSLVDLMAADSEAPHAITTEEIYASNRDSIVSLESPSQKLRRSWIWSYFDHVSDTQAQCKLCKRQINHGGNATGNMNRHLKMIHHKTASTWVWKVFEKEEDVYTCKICQQQLPRKNVDSDTERILLHLKKEHGVVSGDQIITGTDCI